MSCKPVSATASAANIARRAVRSSPAARAAVGSAPLRRAIGAQRAARRLRPAVRFLLREARAGTVGRYRIRGTDLAVHLRHASRDIEIFNEIFAPGRMSYEPPAAVTAVLDSLGPLRIADLGGNIGLFGLYALHHWPVAKLWSFEPDPANAALLSATIAANEATRQWELEPVAVSNAYATATFETGLLSESRLAANGHVRGEDAGKDARARGAASIDVKVLDLFAQPPADLLKIDIEGAEWAILGDTRLVEHPAHAIVLEWHRRMCPGPKPRHAARALLEVGGYEAIEVDGGETPGDSRDDDSAMNGVMWGLRR